MANITISDLRPAGFDLFADPENYVSELSDNELGTINGGVVPTPIVTGTPHTPKTPAIAKSVASAIGTVRASIEMSNPLNSI